VRWLPTDMKEDELDALSLPTGARLAYDVGKNPVILFAERLVGTLFRRDEQEHAALRLPVQTAKE
jgi:hypothetical protein